MFVCFCCKYTVHIINTHTHTHIIEDEAKDDENGNSSDAETEAKGEEDKLELHDPEKDMLSTLISNNDLWREVISDFPFDFVSILSYELDDRIIDLSHILKILSDKAEKEFNSVAELMKFVEKRHKNVWNDWKENVLNENQNTVEVINNNNDRWRQCLRGTDEVELNTNILLFLFFSFFFICFVLFNCFNVF